MSEVNTPNPLPGFMLRREWAAARGRCDRTAKRAQDRGEIVVRYFGKDPYVDIEATVARARGEDRPKRRSRAA